MTARSQSGRCPVITLFCVLLLLLPAQVRNQTVADIYANNRSIVDLTVEELRRSYPEELGDLEPAEDQDHLRTILQKAGDNVDLFFRNLPRTAAREKVRIERLRSDGKVDEHSERSFNYVIEARPEGDGFQVEEFRSDSKGHPLPREKLRGFSISTSGFTAAGIVFHPNYQIISRFRYLGRQSSDGKAYLIGFAQKPETGVFVGAFRVEGMPPNPVYFQGLAWIDPETFQILRLRTDLLVPRTDIGLVRQTSEIWFHEVRFTEVAQSFWLPREVVVTATSYDQRFRSRHQYSEYIVFVVESRDKLEMPKIKKTT